MPDLVERVQTLLSRYGECPGLGVVKALEEIARAVTALEADEDGVDMQGEVDTHVLRTFAKYLYIDGDFVPAAVTEVARAASEIERLREAILMHRAARTTLWPDDPDAHAADLALWRAVDPDTEPGIHYLAPGQEDDRAGVDHE